MFESLLHSVSLQIVSIFLICGILSSCQRVHEKKEIYPSRSITKSLEKQKGAHVFGLRDTTDFKFLHRNNIEWVTIVPWGFQEDYDSPSVGQHDGESIAMVQYNARWEKRLRLVNEAGFKIFLKPHVWINAPSDGKWRSDIAPSTDLDWETWKESYRKFILRYARLAEESDVEMFCIGTEFTTLTSERPEFWRKLINEVRKVYTGKLTYAANWYKEYEQVSFWEELDYIGVQAYFPLTNKHEPTVDQLSQGWATHKKKLQNLSDDHQRKILFTEMGYKSTKDSGIEPWAWLDEAKQEEKNRSLETQVRCYEAFFQTIWPEDWFAGVHLWQFHTGYKYGEPNLLNQDFTPQGKPAEKIIASGFGVRTSVLHLQKK